MRDGKYPDPREEDIVYGDRRLSRPDVSLPDWEVPDSTYRPVPIVWFTGALFAELFVLGLIFAILSSQSGWLTMTLCMMATVAVGKWTWDRGMGGAGTGWQVATVTMLAAQMAFLTIAVAHRL